MCLQFTLEYGQLGWFDTVVMGEMKKGLGNKAVRVVAFDFRCRLMVLETNNHYHSNSLSIFFVNNSKNSEPLGYR